MTVQPNPVRRIAIAGNGFEAWFTANHLLAGLGGSRIEIRVCPVAGSDVNDDIYAILPTGENDGLGKIGLSAPLLARRCAASFSLGGRFNGRARPYGSIGVDINGLPFHHHWLRSASMGADDYFSWTPAAMAMQEQRFAPPSAENAIGQLRHGMAMHVDIGLLTDLLKARALNSNASEWTGVLSSVDFREDGGISRLNSDQGEHTEADLFIDCSGEQRSLVKDGDNALFTKAQSMARFTCSARRSEGEHNPPPFHSINTQDDGWCVQVPGNGWTALLDIKTDENGSRPGHLRRPWNANRVAIGQAAATLPPVEPLHAKLLAMSLKRLLDLLPDAACADTETGEYNHLFETEMRDVEDLCIAYEMARAGGDSGLGARQEAGASLARRLSLFHRRGWISPSDGELLQPGDWVDTFLLLGLVPERHDLLAERLPQEKLENYLERLREQIQRTASGFPPHSRYMDAVNKAARP